MDIKLFTRDGSFMVDLSLPVFNTAPDVVIWGNRFFVVSTVAENYTHYREASSYAVPVAQGAVGMGKR